MLTVVCEGRHHMLEYLNRNGVYPSRAIFDSRKYREIAPYLKEEDEVLVIINGATDFSMSKIYGLLRDVEESMKKVRSIKIMSNIPLGGVKTKYVQYKGDLFYGEVEKKNEEVIEVEEGEELGIRGKIKNKLKAGRSSNVEKEACVKERGKFGIFVKKEEKVEEKVEVNEEMKEYKEKYSRKIDEVQIWDIEESVKKEEEDVYINLIKEVDLFD